MNFQETNREFIKTMLIKVWFKNDNSMNLLIEQTLNILNDWIQWEILTALSENQMEDFDKLVSGAPTDEEIYKFLTDRYGDFILLKPPFKLNTLALWLLPFVFVLIGIFIVFFHNKKSKKI